MTGNPTKDRAKGSRESGISIPSAHETLTLFQIVFACVASISAVVGFFLAPLPVVVAGIVGVLLSVAWRADLLDPELRSKRIVTIGSVTLLVALIGIAYARAAAPGPISAQVDEILTKANSGDTHTIYQWRGVLHGDRQSLVVVIAHSRTHDIGRSDLSQPDSDELLIYDVDGDKVKLKSSFWPQRSGEVAQLPEGDSPSFRFRIRSISDVAGNGSRMILGAFERFTMASGPYPVPVVLGWDPRDSEYEMSPLFGSAPDLSSASKNEALALTGYTRPTEIIDRSSGVKLPGFAVWQYAVKKGNQGPVVAATFFDEMRPEQTELRAWRLDAEQFPPKTYACFPADERRNDSIGNAMSGPSDILEVLKKLDSGDCGI